MFSLFLHSFEIESLNMLGWIPGMQRCMVGNDASEIDEFNVLMGLLISAR